MSWAVDEMEAPEEMLFISGLRLSLKDGRKPMGIEKHLQKHGIVVNARKRRLYRAYIIVYSDLK